METIIRLYLTNDPIKFHAAWTLNDKDAVSDDEVLEKGYSLSVPYATYEENYWLLDGNYKFLPATDANVGYWSDALSDVDGVSSTALGSIEINFDAEYDFDKITIRGCEYSNDYSSRVLVEYFKDNVKIDDIEIHPNQSVYTFSNAVEDIDEIHFTFYDTNNPYRRVRVSDIIFGDMVEFRGENVKSASVIMETSPLSTELPSGVFQCNLYSDDPIFDMIDPDSLYSQLQERMMIDVLYDKGAQVDFIGRYYLANDGRKNISENEIHIEGKDLVGLWDDVTYNGDFWASDEDFPTIINRILSFSDDVKTVTIDSAFTSLMLRGNIVPGTVRTAMQQALFAGGASMEIFDGTTVHIFEQKFLNINGTPEIIITRAEKALENQSLTDVSPVTKIDLTSHSYVMAASATEIFKETLTGGTYTLYFDTPAWFSQDNVTNATLTASGPNYAVIEVSGTKEVTITGKEFSHNQIVSSQAIAASTARPNTIQVSDATMISPDVTSTVITRMQFYYLLRFMQQFRAFNPAFYQPSYIYHVDTIKDRKVAMVIERAEIDLSSGFVCDFKGTGVIIGNELIQRKYITVGDEGSVTPNQFEYPRQSPQRFMAALFSDYFAEHGINVAINGVNQLYMDTSAQFIVASTTANTSVVVTFPDVTKAITVGPRGTVTPAKFRFPQAAEQSFIAKVSSAYLNDYGIGIKIDGVRTLYLLNEQAFSLTNTVASTAVEVDFPSITKAITVGPRGTVTPAKFRFPQAAEQSFIAKVAETYQADYGIGVKIDGTRTVYTVAEQTFKLSNTTDSTAVEVDFPVITKAITVGYYLTVTPSKFKYPQADAQSFAVKNTATYQPYSYYIQEKINGVTTKYDIAERTMQLTNTNENTSVEISLVLKSSKAIQCVGFNSQWDSLGNMIFYYPVIGTQRLSARYMYQSGWIDGIPYISEGKADYRWYVDGVLKSTQIQVGTSTFDLTNATSSTVVRVERSNTTDGSGGGGGGGGGGGYTPWEMTVGSGGWIVRDAPNESGNFIASTGANTKMTITNEISGWYYGTITASVYVNTVGMSGWINAGAKVAGYNPN
ncbi:MAG: hypothetical protein AB9907_14675 [Flexilinea sp.]